MPLLLAALAHIEDVDRLILVLEAIDLRQPEDAGKELRHRIPPVEPADQRFLGDVLVGEDAEAAPDHAPPRMAFGIAVRDRDRIDIRVELVRADLGAARIGMGRHPLHFLRHRVRNLGLQESRQTAGTFRRQRRA